MLKSRYSKLPEENKHEEADIGGAIRHSKSNSKFSKILHFQNSLKMLEELTDFAKLGSIFARKSVEKSGTTLI